MLLRVLLLVVFGLPTGFSVAEEGEPVASRYFEFTLSRKRGDEREHVTESIITKVQPYFYTVEIENRNELPANDLRMEYWILIDRGLDVGQARDRRYEKVEGVKGEVEIKLMPSRQPMVFTTKTIEEESADLRRDYYFERDVVEHSKDKLLGIWVRLYHGETLLAETSSTSSLPRNHRWKDGQPED